jgi:hypothetical protein
MEQGTDNGNGRVTLAIIGTKLDEVIRRLDKIDANQCKNDDEIGLLREGAVKRDTLIATLRQDVDQNCEDVEALKGSDRKWGIANGLFASVIALLASHFKI